MNLMTTMEIISLKNEMNICIIIYMQFKVSPEINSQIQIGNP